MGIYGPWSNQSGCLAPQTVAFLVSLLPSLPSLPSKLHSQSDLLRFLLSPEHKCPPRVLVCYLSGMGVRQSGSFPQSTTEANRKAHKHAGPLQRSGPKLPGPATHLPLLRLQVPLTSTHTWEELQPACLKKCPPQGYPGRQNMGFDIKAEQQG